MKGQSKQERDQMILDNRQLIRFTIWFYDLTAPYGMEFEDMVQCGSVGLIEAVDRYDPKIGRFSTYAIVKIRCAILEGFRAYGQRIPCESLEEKAFLAWAEDFSIEDELEEQSVKAAFCHLCETEQKTVYDYYERNLSMRRIAEERGVSYYQVRYELRQAKKHLRLYLN